MTRVKTMTTRRILLSAILLLAGLCSCKKEEPADPIKTVELTVEVSVPEALLNVTEMTVMARTADGMTAQKVDSPIWKYAFPLINQFTATTVPVILEISLKGKEVEKGDYIDAGIKYRLSFDAVCESGKKVNIDSYAKDISARVVWLSSTGTYGTLSPMFYTWKGELKVDGSAPAGYVLYELTQ